jgi:hypothetical protein
MFAKRRGRRRKAGPPVHDDHVQRQFTAPRPNQLWLTDITEHRTAWIPAGTGKLYLSAIKDVYSNRIVGYSIDSRMKASLAASALRISISRREPEGTVVHFRSRLAISFEEVRPCPGQQRPGRIDGACRSMWWQCLDGIVFLAPAEQRPRHETVDYPARTSQSSRGSNAPTTDDADNAPSASSHPSSTR